MIFKETAPQVLDGTKRQTRRPVKPGEWAVDATDLFIPPEDTITPIHTIYDRSGRLKWQVGKDYAIQMGRGKKAIGRTPPIETIRREKLSEITPADCIAEGIEAHLVLFDHEYYHIGSEIPFGTPRLAFKDLWNSLYPKPYRWEDYPFETPEVWVLEFEKEGEMGEE